MQPNRQADQFECVHEDIPNQPGRKVAVFWDDEDTGPWSDAPRNFDSKGQPVQPGWYWCDVEYTGLKGETRYLNEPRGPYPESEGAYLAAIGD